MGRPIKRKYFGVGNVNDGESFSGVGGEGVQSVTITSAGSNYSQGVNFTVAPSPIGGVTAVLSDTEYVGNGAIATVTVVTSGSGYDTAPAISIVKPSNVIVTATSTSPANANITVSSTSGLYVGMFANVGFSSGKILAINQYGTNIVTMSSANTANLFSTTVSFGDIGSGGALTAVLYPTPTTANTIQGNAWIGVGSLGKICDIVSQRSSRRYRVTNADGTDVVRLVPAIASTSVDNITNNTLEPTVAQVTAAGGPIKAGEMTITATDSANGTYWVSKLTDRVAILYPAAIGGNSAGTQFTAGQKVSWVFNGPAVVNKSVTIAQNN